MREILEQCSALGIELDRETMEAAEHATLLDELLARIESGQREGDHPVILGRIEKAVRERHQNLVEKLR